MKKIFILLITILSINSSSFAQESDYPLPTIIPPSPNAASIGAFGQVPVGKFTGTIQLNIPIFDYSSDKLNLPISLNYSSNGIRVDEVTSHVGFGWSLHAGGVITRSVFDDPDEIGKLEMPDVGLYTEDMLSFLVTATTPNQKDTQPDLFSFNFNGFSGKFVLDKDMNPILLEPSPLKIEIYSSLDNASSNTSPVFKIVDPNGVIYWFGGEDANEETYNQSSGCGTHTPPSMIAQTAWYITKITHPSGDEINFIYDQVSYNYNTGLSQTYTLKYDEPLYLGFTDCTYINRVHSTSSLLKEINSQGFGKIQFEYSVAIPNSEGNQHQKLNQIKLLNDSNSILKQFDLEYYIFNTDLSYKNNDVSTQSTDEKRLFLSKVTEIGKSQIPKPSYLFEYNDADKLPPRFSYAQDYWGYFNGKSNNSDLVSSEGYPEFAQSTINSDRNANGFYGAKGLLTKITYPTGGYNEFLYEPHTINALGTIYPSVEHKSFIVETDENDIAGASDIQLINNIPFTQNVYINSSLMFNSYNSSCDINNYPSHWITANFTIKDLTTGQNTNFFQDTPGGQVLLGTSLVIQESGMPYDKIFATLSQGKSYELKLNVSKYCLYASVDLNYYDQDNQQVYQNVEIGGVRIQQVISNKGNGINEIKKYNYNTLNDFSKSTGIAELAKSAYSVFSEIGVEDPNTVITSYTLSSSSHLPLYLSQGYHIGYTSVIEGFGSNFENGGISNIYTMNLSEQPIVILNDYIPGTRNTNIFGIGNELVKKAFKKENDQFIIVSSEEKIYKQNSILDQELIVHNINKRAHYGVPAGDLITKIKAYNIVKYKIKSQWHYLDSTKVMSYDINGENPNTTTTKYFYDNEKHFQATRIRTIDSEGNFLESQMYYPDDVHYLNSLPGSPQITFDQFWAINGLNIDNQHRIARPIQTETLKNGVLQSRQRINFKDWGNNIINQESIETSKGIETFEPRLTYQDYDAYGNPLEVSKKDGAHIVYIWGYNHSKPVAKIENATYSQIEALSYFGNDFDLGIGNLSINQKNSLRTGLSNSQVTTYTYDLLVGVTSITDPSEYTSYYVYDDFNRLQYIKDKDGNVLEQYRYNYALEELVANATSSTSSASVGDTVTFTANITGGSGDFNYEWIVPGESNLPNTNQITITTTSSHTPSLTATCNITDNQTQESITVYKTVTVSQSYPALSVANIISSPGSTTTSVGSSLTYSIVVSGGSGSYNYKWTKTNSQYTLTLANGSASSITDTVHIDDCSDFSVKCEVTDNITGEVITKTRTMYVIFGCSGGGFPK